MASAVQLQAETTQRRSELSFRRFATPRENGAALIEPPFSAIGDVVARNVEERARWQYDCQGRALADLSDQARAELLTEARRWTSAYRGVEMAAEDPRGLIFLAGHQPELFHPGVWFKNFALGALARQHGAAAVNLVIDSDTVKHTELRTPDGTPSDPRLRMIPFDQPGQRVPFEERAIADCRTFFDFGARVAEWIAPLVPDPLVRQYWPMVLARSEHTGNLGYCLAQARHQLEGRWGLQSLELPQSSVCACESFFWLVAHLAAHAARFRETYNQAVHAYREANGIRNPAHPVPDLAQDGEWLEAPFWIWTSDRPQRRHLFVRQSGRDMLLSDRAALEIRLPLTAHGDGEAAVVQLKELARHGVKIRSRALITTLWARLVLGDLFLHGIGGAKYDQVTDLVIERFFGLRPPGIMVLSATLLLPLPRERVTAERARELRRQLRELTFHPEKHIGDGLALEPVGLDRLRQLLAAKQRWIRTPQTLENAGERWRAFQETNLALQPYVASERDRLLEAQSRTTRMVRAESIFAWREYGFCLYPETSLKKFLEDLLPNSA